MLHNLCPVILLTLKPLNKMKPLYKTWKTKRVQQMEHRILNLPSHDIHARHTLLNRLFDLRKGAIIRYCFFIFIQLFYFFGGLACFCLLIFNDIQGEIEGSAALLLLYAGCCSILLAIVSHKKARTPKYSAQDLTP